MPNKCTQPKYDEQGVTEVTKGEFCRPESKIIKGFYILR